MPPKFYDPQRVGERYRPNVAEAMRAGSATNTTPSDDDKKRLLLVLVDMQVDFIHPEGMLSVPGAVDDTRRTVEWIYDHLGAITSIAASLDSHIPGQIFYPTWWVDADGEHPEAYTVVSHADVQAGKWRPIKEAEWSQQYVKELEQKSKKQLMIWPYHTMIGSEGHNLMPALYEAMVYHSAARNTQPHIITKGMIPDTEFYSLLEPEVKVPSVPGGTLNMEFIAQMERYDAVYITGQAKSHCVLETVRTLMRQFADKPEMIDKLHVLIDSTSSVAHPEIDFEAMASVAYKGFAEKGLHLDSVNDPLAV